MIEEFILKHRKKIITFLAWGLILVLVAGPLTFFNWKPIKLFGQKEVMAQTNSTTTLSVSAEIQAWLDFSVNPDNVDLGALVLSTGESVLSSSTDIQLNIGTNNPSGWYVDIRGANAGLYNATTSYLIATVNGTSTLVTGVDGYGANATGTLSGVTVGSYYNFWGTQTVGEIASSTLRRLIEKDSSNSTQQVGLMKVWATATSTAPVGIYQDTATLTAVAPY